jgi:hypothetical protein
MQKADWQRVNLELAQVRLKVFQQELEVTQGEVDRAVWQGLIKQMNQEIGNIIQQVVA